MKNIISLAKLDLALHDAFGLNQPMLNIIKQLKHKFKEDWSLNTQKDKKNKKKKQQGGERKDTSPIYYMLLKSQQIFYSSLSS